MRSGILALYLGLFVVGVHHAISSKKYWLILATLIGIMAVPFIAIQTIPSLHQKIHYAKWDYSEYQQGRGGNSDSERIMSLKIGMEIGNQYPILGVGAGDLKKEVKKIYNTYYMEKFSFRMPHNQLVSIYAGTGIVGLFLFLFAFFYPLFHQKKFHNPLFLALHAIIFISFMTENTLENNFGISLYLFFLLMGINYLDTNT